MSQVTNKDDIEMLLNLKEEDITSSFVMSLFGEFDGKRKYDTGDVLTVPPNTYKVNGKYNKNKFTTAIGVWIFNKLFIEKELTHVLGYVNKSIDAKTFDDLNAKLSYALAEDRITVEELKHYLMKTQFVTPFVTFLSSNMTEKMLLSIKDIDKRKEKLLKENEAAIKAGDANTVDKIEKELLDFAKENLKDDESMDIYNSGARGSFNNNFKNMYVMKGAVQDPDPNKGYNIITSSYMDGITKEEFSDLANSLSAGPYARSKKTEMGGYMEKQFVAAFQHIIALPKGSDCGTKRYIEMTLTDSNIKNMMYSYIVEGSRLVRLDSSNMDKYRGKTVKFRFASMCESKEGICNKCLGDMFYITDTTNVGVASSTLPAKLKLKNMKSFHDSTVKLVDMDVEKAFGF